MLDKMLYTQEPTFLSVNVLLLLFDGDKVISQRNGKDVFAVVECLEDGMQRVNVRTSEDGVQAIEHDSTKHVISLSTFTTHISQRS